MRSTRSLRADPSMYLDLLTLKPAQTNWAAITGFVSQLQQIDVQMGAPVALDIAHGKIVQQTSLV